jgi:hypothetical protein
MGVCVLLLIALCTVRAAPTGGVTSALLSGAPVSSQVWEDATNATVTAARECLALTPVYLRMYYPQFMSAFLTPLTVPDLIKCEALLLGTAYSHLSTMLSMCVAMAHGVRQCAHYIAAYAGTPPTGNPDLIPSAFPVQNFNTLVAQCNAAVEALPPIEQNISTFLFRRRFSPGTICLRKNTREALLQDILFP